MSDNASSSPDDQITGERPDLDAGAPAPDKEGTAASGEDTGEPEPETAETAPPEPLDDGAWREPAPGASAIGDPAPTDPFMLFSGWLKQAERTELNDPNAMTLATCTPGGAPAARIVLLKSADADGFVFYTNTQSRKGNEIGQNPKVALLFHWKTLHRQVRVEGTARPVSPAEADAYFESRRRLARHGAWASDQSRPLPNRGELERRVLEMEERFSGPIPRPPHWSGFRVRAERFEFWEDRPYRLHDRRIYTRMGPHWAISSLYP